MHSGIQLLILGTGATDTEQLARLHSADLVIARGKAAFDWVDSFSAPNIRLFSKDAGQKLSHWAGSAFSFLPENALVVYVTPITPVMADQVALSLVNAFGSERLQIANGLDRTKDLVKLVHGECPISILTLDGLSLENRHHPVFSPDDAVMIHFPEDAGSLEVFLRLSQSILPADHQVFTLIPDKQGKLDWRQIQLQETPSLKDQIVTLYIPPQSHDSSLESFQEVIAHLRAPEDGCPWDKKQTHSSLRTYLLEETYEALDALDKNDPLSLKEELGDILLQILLHAQIALESGEFSMADVIRAINRKIVYRHPHVFKDWVVNDEKDVVQNWETLKGKERQKNGDAEKKGMLDGVPLAFPALAQAQAIQDRAARVGFDWPEIGPVLDKVMEELEEVKTAPNEQERAKELGDLLFAIVNLIRWHKVDAESALRQTNLKFRKRFAYIEEQAQKAGKDLQKMTLAEMDAFWEEAKPFDD